MEKMLMTIGEAAAYLGVSERYIADLVKTRQIEGILLPGRKKIRFTKDILESFVRMNRVKAEAPAPAMIRGYDIKVFEKMRTARIKQIVQDVKNKKP